MGRRTAQSSAYNSAMAARRCAGSSSPKTSRRLRSSSVSMMSGMILFLSDGVRNGPRATVGRLPVGDDGSDLGLAAVDEELGAGHEARIVRGEEGDRLGDLVRVADAADRDLGRHIVEEPLLLGGVRTGQPEKTRGLHRTGTDDVDAYAALLEVERPAPRQIAHRGLGGAVDAEGGRAGHAGSGPHQDYRSAIAQQRQSLLHREDHALHVAAEGILIMLLGNGAERQRRAAAGVGEEDVDL